MNSSMEYINSLKENEDVTGVETGGTSCDDNANIDPVSGKGRANRMLIKFPSGALGYNGSENIESSGIVSGTRIESGEDGIEVLIDKNLGRLQSEEHLPFLEKTNGKEKRKAINSHKAPKPPRPPKGPSLNASDMKLVKEITELNMKKRARMERFKALKKMKAAKPSAQSSSYSTLTAIIVTAVFCFVLIFQGFYSRSSPTVSFQGSPEPASEPKGWISVHVNNLSPNEHAASLESPRVAELHPPVYRSPGELGKFRGISSRYISVQHERK